MSIPTTRHVAAVCHDGHIRLVEQDVPPLTPGSVLVQVHASLVSPGTEVGGWRSLSAKRADPDPEPRSRPFGYSNAGVVLEVAEGVEELKPGDRVACIGGNYAMHTDYAVVPHNLCVPLPDDVTFAQASYGHLAATAMNALRRGEPEFGESVAVAGLGILGQLTARLYQLAGNFVIGWDTIPFRIEVADKWCLDAAVNVATEDEVAATREFTNGHGLDAAVLAFGGDANKTVESIEKCMRCLPDGHPTGRIISVGQARFEYTSTLTNMDLRRSSRPGPGYHDKHWEFGPDYPPVLVRWSTRTNLELCIRLISEGSLEVDTLTTHTIQLERVDEEISAILDEPDSILGVVFVTRHT